MNRRHLILSAIAASLVATRVSAEPLALVPNAQKVGSGHLSVMFIPVFDATLYAPQGHFNATAPYALRLDYLHSFKGSEIARNGVDEMRKQGVSAANLKTWGDRMAAIFPNVGPGSALIGVRDASGHALFFNKSGQQIGTVQDPAFTQHFFDIWLGAKSSQPKLRNQLLGKA